MVSIRFVCAPLLAVALLAASVGSIQAANYNLTVTGGTGSGSYASGAVVPVTANAAPSGYVFSGWQEYSGVLASTTSASTTVTMPTQDVTVTALYAVSGGTTYTLTVNGGTGGGNYPAGTVVTLSANAAPSGSQFVRWIGGSSALFLGNADNSTTTMTTQAAPMTLTATYGQIAPTYTVTVTNGTGSGSYAAGTVLTVTANAPPTGDNFTGWTGGTGALANASFSTTTLTVPAAPVTITANFAATTSTNALTVNGGTGGGTYAPGTAVTVTAAAPASGMQFAGWSGGTSFLSNAAAPKATFFMPSGPAAITANYTTISANGSLVLAVGLERLVAGYNGPAIRIQRPSDNTQADIGFAAASNLLDTTAVTNFLGQSQGWITTLYAQDGSGNNVGTALPTSTATMPTISALDPTSIAINGTSALTARNIEAPFQGGQGNARYFVLPASVSVNRSQMSAFLAFRPDWAGSGTGDPFMSYYEVGDPTVDAVDIYSVSSGFQGLTHNSAVQFSNTGVYTRSQPSVLGLVTAPGATPLIYVDGTSHPATDIASGNTTIPVSATVSGGYLMAGTGTGIYYGVPLWAQYNFLGFELYSGTVSASTAATISNTMLPRSAPSINIVGDGDSITQGTGGVYGYNMLHFLEPLLSQSADITDLAIYGTTSPSAVGHGTYPTNAGSDLAKLYRPAYARNIYYLDIGTNDIHGGFLDGNGTWAEVVQALQAAKSLGYKTAVTTLLHETGESATASANIDTFNADARAAVGQPYLDGLIDYQADRRLGQTSFYYPAFTGDGTHPNDVGYAIMASIAAPVINGLIGGSPATLVSAVSRQVHGAAGNFDLALPLTGTPTVECRQSSTAGAYSIVLTFSQAVTSLTATLQIQAGHTGQAVGAVGAPVINGTTVTIPLTGVGNAQRLDVHLAAIQPGNGTADVPVSILLGDVNGDGAVTSLDIPPISAAYGSTGGQSKFNPRADLNCDGAITTLDLNPVKLYYGKSLP
jgi:lysophospholipase L1-like esterase